MIRTTITPVTTQVNLSIPKDYIGKKIEVLLYALEELSTQDSVKKTMSDFWGVLNASDTKELHKHVEQSRKEWERNT